MPLPDAARKTLQAAAALVSRRVQTYSECYPDIIEHLLVPLFRDVAPEQLKEAHRRAQQIDRSHAQATRLVDAGAAYALATEHSPATASATMHPAVGRAPRKAVQTVMLEAARELQRSARAVYDNKAYTKPMRANAELAFSIAMELCPVSVHAERVGVRPLAGQSRVEEYDGRAAGCIAWLVECNKLTAEMEAVADHVSFPGGNQLSRNAVARKMLDACAHLHTAVAMLVEVGNVKKQVVDGPVAELFQRFVVGMGVGKDHLIFDAVMLPKHGAGLAAVVETCVPKRQTRAVLSGAHAVSVTDGITEAYTHYASDPDVAEHLYQQARGAAAQGRPIKMAIGFDGFKATRNGDTFMCIGLVRPMTLATNLNQVHTVKMFLMNAHDKAQQVYEHVLPQLLGQPEVRACNRAGQGHVFKLVRPARVGLDGNEQQAEPFDYPVVSFVLLSDMFAVCTALGCLAPTVNYWWLAAPEPAALCQAFHHDHGVLYLGVPNRTRDFARRYHALNPTDDEMKSLGWDPNCPGLRDKSFAGFDFGADGTAKTGLLHYYSMFKVTIAVIAAAARERGGKHFTAMVEHGRTLKGVKGNYRLFWDATSRRMQSSMRQGDCATVVLKASPMDMFAVPTLGKAFCLNVGRLMACLKFMTMVMNLTDPKSAHLIRFYPAVANTAASILAAWTSTGAGNDVFGKLTPSFQEAVSYTCTWLHKLLADGEMPGMWSDRVTEDGHPDLMWKVQLGVHTGGGHHGHTETARITMQLEKLLTSAIFCNTVGRQTAGKRIPALDARSRKAGAALHTDLLQCFKLKEDAPAMIAKTTGEGSFGLAGDEVTVAAPFTGHGAAEWELTAEELAQMPPANDPQGPRRVASLRAGCKHVAGVRATNRKPPTKTVDVLVTEVVWTHPTQRRNDVTVCAGSGVEISAEYDPRSRNSFVLRIVLPVTGGTITVTHKMELPSITEFCCETAKGTKGAKKKGATPASGNGVVHLLADLPVDFVLGDKVLLTSKGLGYDRDGEHVTQCGKTSGIKAGDTLLLECVQGKPRAKKIAVVKEAPETHAGEVAGADDYDNDDLGAGDAEEQGADADTNHPPAPPPAAVDQAKSKSVQLSNPRRRVEQRYELVLRRCNAGRTSVTPKDAVDTSPQKDIHDNCTEIKIYGSEMLRSVVDTARLADSTFRGRDSAKANLGPVPTGMDPGLFKKHQAKTPGHFKRPLAFDDVWLTQQTLTRALDLAMWHRGQHTLMARCADCNHVLATCNVHERIGPWKRGLGRHPHFGFWVVLDEQVTTTADTVTTTSVTEDALAAMSGAELHNLVATAPLHTHCMHTYQKLGLDKVDLSA